MNGEDRAYFEKYLEEKFKNLHKRIDDVMLVKNKVDELPCIAHETNISNNKTSISRLWFGFVVVIIGGIVLGLWIKTTSAGM